RRAHEEHQKGNLTKTDFQAIEKKVWDKLDAVEAKAKETDGLKARIDELETKMTRPPFAGVPEAKGGDAPEVKAFSGWLRKGAVGPDEQKLMRTSDDTVGGYIAPTERRNKLIEILTEISPVRQLATVETIGGSSVEFPKEGGDTIDCAWDDEALTEGDAKFKMERFDPHVIRALVLIKKTLLEDADFNLESYLYRKAAQKFAKKEGVAFISANGKSKPEGLLTNSEISFVKSGSASTFTGDSFINLIYDLPADYAKGARFLMNRKTVGKIALLKDNNGQYLWRPGLQAGQPSTLLGYSIFEAVDMPDVAANAFPVMFGDFAQAYWIIERLSIEVQRLVEVYATGGKIGFLFRRRVDAQVVLGEALRKMKIAA
ncbi:MAG: phage major capsid protein, partial [Candidatus Aminicenantes bacterium]|nr:phage major capsid protein [Candidatus Aminicenantes bacterium]